MLKECELWHYEYGVPDGMSQEVGAPRFTVLRSKRRIHYQYHLIDPYIDGQFEFR